MKKNNCNYGCPYLAMNSKYEEECTLTGARTNGAVKCDFDFARCPEYLATVKDEKECDLLQAYYV